MHILISWYTFLEMHGVFVSLIGQRKEKRECCCDEQYQKKPGCEKLDQRKMMMIYINYMKKKVVQNINPTKQARKNYF